MKLWKNTKTLDKYLRENLIDVTEDKSEAHIALLGGKGIVLSEFPKLKAIYRVGVGDDNIPYDECLQKGIKVYIPSNELKLFIYEETANFTCSLILQMLYKDVGDINTWDKKERSFLGSKRLLVIGTGHIGSIVSKKMSVFMKVDTYDILQNSQDDLQTKISKADVISLHIPMTESNRGFFNSDKMLWMKKGSILINTARGNLVDEYGLYDMILSGHIKAAFDVFWKEPYDGKLKKFPREYFYMTPHVASICEEFLNGAYLELLDIFKGYK